MEELTPQEIANHISFKAAHIAGVVGVWNDDAPECLKIFSISIYRHHVSRTYRFHIRGPYKPKHVVSATLDGVLALGFRMISRTPSPVPGRIFRKRREWQTLSMPRSPLCVLSSTMKRSPDE